MPTARILLTNDDGVHRDGIIALRAALLAAGCAVTTIAPDRNRSGVSRAVTIHDDVEVQRVGAGESTYACTGTPADCTRIGLLSDLAGGASLVVSGINHGVNLGDDAGYSGTVGAALVGASLGRCGVAFSQQGDDHDVGLAERGRHTFGLAPVAAAIARRVGELPLAGAVLNVNLPSRLDVAHPVAITRLGRLRYRRGWLVPRPEPGADGALLFRAYAGTTGEAPEHETSLVTDFGAVLAGRIAVTALEAPTGAEGDTAAWIVALGLGTVVRDALAALPPGAITPHPAPTEENG